MRTLNKVLLIGNLGKDPDLRFTPSGTPVSHFPIATHDKWTDKNNQTQEKTEWHNITLWDKLAEIAHQYLKKGDPVFIEGKITTESWTNKDNQKQYSTKIIGRNMILLPTSQEPQPDKELPF